MRALRRWQFAGLVALWLVPDTALAIQPGRENEPNATIVNANVNLRRSYPKYGASTLVKFRLASSEVLAVIPRGTRVKVSARKVVANQEWLETTYVNDGERLRGWVYAGDKGARRYVRLDRGVRLSTARMSGTSGLGMLATAATVLLPTPVYAQHLEIEVADDRPPPTDVLMTLGLPALQILVILAATIATRHWIFPTSEKYTFLMVPVYVSMFGIAPHMIWGDMIGAVLAAK